MDYVGGTKEAVALLNRLEKAGCLVSVYTKEHIDDLSDEGLIAEAPGDGARRAFAATDAGRAEIEARAEEVAAIIDRLKALAEASDRESSPSILRAMANLKLALKGRVFAAAFDESVAHQIADILDEAARRIERL